MADRPDTAMSLRMLAVALGCAVEELPLDAALGSLGRTTELRDEFCALVRAAIARPHRIRRPTVGDWVAWCAAHAEAVDFEEAEREPVLLDYGGDGRAFIRQLAYLAARTEAGAVGAWQAFAAGTGIAEAVGDALLRHAEQALGVSRALMRPQDWVEGLAAWVIEGRAIRDLVAPLPPPEGHPEPRACWLRVPPPQIRDEVAAPVRWWDRWLDVEPRPMPLSGIAEGVAHAMHRISAHPESLSRGQRRWLRRARASGRPGPHPRH